MSGHLIGFRVPDENFENQKQVFIACVKARVSVPSETLKYFDNIEPYEHNIHLIDSALTVKIPHHEYHADMEDGLEINVSEIPSGVQRIRFWNSY